MNKPSLLSGLILPTVALAGLLLLRNELPVRAADVTLNGVPVPSFKSKSLSPAEFEKLHRGVAPGKERWAEIPWETDLAAARARSAREGKPLLMWVMDGHPLGCT